MKKTMRRVVASIFAVLMLVSLFPVSAFAVDPVSAATMANALAQAITAYGASNGVSMMFDVASSDGIGEAMHDLWGQFKTDVQDNNVPTYDSLAVTIWSTVFQKVGNNVGINLSDTQVSYMDAFWNWLLTGPAEMTKVDNEYYQWSVDQNNQVAPINVLQNSLLSIGGNPSYSSPLLISGSIQDNTFTASGVYFYLVVPSGGSSSFDIVGVSSSSSFVVNRHLYNKNNGASGDYTINVSGRSYGDYYYGYVFTGVPSSPSSYTYYESSISTINYWYLENVFGAASSADISTTSDGLSVQPYIGESSPDRIYIPDNNDVNYQPLPYVGPLNIPWLNDLFGPGDTLSDAQKKAIADQLDDAIEDDGTLQLEEEGTDNPDLPGEVIGNPDDYQVPGLAEVFPFCIPFDIYNFLSALAAAPEAPCFTCNLDFPAAIGGRQTIELDFDTPTWNQLAQLLRLLELLAFIVGLALLTRSMFIRG